MAGKFQRKKSARKVQEQARDIFVQSQVKLTDAIAETDPVIRKQLIEDAASLATSAKQLSTHAAKMVD